MLDSSSEKIFLNILIIDDEPFILDIFSHYLANRGFNVQVASNQKEAIKYLSTSHFDLVLTDVVMKTGDFSVFLKNVKNSPSGINKIPIIAPLGLGKNDQTYNINGDTAASAIAKKLKSRRLILMTNVEGVYDDQKKLISEIKPFDLENLIKWKVVQGGMIPKIENCVDAVQNGVRGVVILDGRKPHSVLHEIFSDKGSGTLIRE